MKKMKAKEITLTIVRNIGPYESARMSVQYEIDETKVTDAFRQAKAEIEESFRELFDNGNKEEPISKISGDELNEFFK